MVGGPRDVADGTIVKAIKGQHLGGTSVAETGGGGGGLGGEGGVVVVVIKDEI